LRFLDALKYSYNFNQQNIKYVTALFQKIRNNEQ